LVICGDPKATDSTIIKWGLKNGCWVVTNDLDFGDILAVTDARGPSVVQFRTQDLSPAHIKPILLTVLKQYNRYLESGALILVEETRSRVRILPLRRE
jgi:predicted nuclease of predicted toxin-antitoxin system